MSASAPQATVRRRKRPGAQGEPASLYVIQFDNGVIKVGRTADADSRRADHARDAARFGLTVVNAWSRPSNDAVREEDRLIRRLETLGVRTGGREYFSAIPFTIARHVAEGTCVEFGRVSCCCGRCVGTMEFTLPAVVKSPVLPDLESSALIAEFGLACGGRVVGRVGDPDFGVLGRYPLTPGQQVEIVFERRSVAHDDWTIWGATDRAD